MTQLNEEMQDLIAEERQLNQEEVVRIEKQFQMQLKSAESKQLLYRNKLLTLASHYDLFVATNFTSE